MKLYLPLCQCPSTGLSHFYYPELEIVFDAPKCVNALLRAYPISTVSIPMATDQSEVCQCPSTGLSHFYPDGVVGVELVNNSCQCPSTSLSHFYSIRNDKV